MKKVVVIGGGTGTFVVLSGLKALANLELAAIVTVADSGGSTGRLRDEFGFLPVGDLRQALAALASQEIINHKSEIRYKYREKNWIRELLLYRFSKGQGLEGHNLGNLVLTALQDMTGSTAKAIEVASKIFRLRGHIYPITTKSIQLVAEYRDGSVEIGEHMIDDSVKHGGDRIVNLKTSPRAEIYPPAAEAIKSADVIIIGPGDLYSSILPNLIIDGAVAAVKNSKGKLIYIMNLMTRYAQTYNMSAADHLRTIELHAGRRADAVIVNNEKIPTAILSAYRKQHEYPVVDDLGGDSRVMRLPLIKTTLVKQFPNDLVRRSYLRHDPNKLRLVLMNIIGDHFSGNTGRGIRRSRRTGGEKGAER